MKERAERAVVKDRPALEARVSMESRPTADSSAELERGRGVVPPTQEETSSPRPTFRKRSRKPPKPPGVSMIMDRRLESKEVVLLPLIPNCVPTSAKTASSVAMVMLLLRDSIGRKWTEWTDGRRVGLRGSELTRLLGGSKGEKEGARREIGGGESGSTLVDQ